MNKGALTSPQAEITAVAPEHDFATENFLILVAESLTSYDAEFRLFIQIRGVAGLGRKIFVVSVEPRDSYLENHRGVQADFVRDGIIWCPILVSRPAIRRFRISAALRIMIMALRIFRSQKINALHCHDWTYAASLASMARIFRVPLVLNFSEFEGVAVTNHVNADSNSWCRRIFLVGSSWIKQWTLSSANHVILASEQAVARFQALAENRKQKSYSVCSPAFDFAAFDGAAIKREADQRYRGEHKIWIGRPVLVCFGGDRCQAVFDIEMRFFREFSKIYDKALIVFLNSGSIDDIYSAAKRNRLAKGKIRVIQATREQLPIFLNMATAGLIFSRQPHGTADASQAIADFLALGVPVVTVKNVDDWDRVFAENSFGYILENFSDQEMQKATEKTTGDAVLSKEQISLQIRKIFSKLPGIELLQVYRSAGFP
jgi:hypothetical protein